MGSWDPGDVRYVDPKSQSCAAEQDGCRDMTTGKVGRTSEQTLADMFREDLGVTLDPQALRIFVRLRFSRLSPLAHRIHDGKR